MKIEEIKKALEHFENEKGIAITELESCITTESEELLKSYISIAETTISILCSELKKVENKLLTLDELKNRSGKPVFIISRGEIFCECWFIIEEVDGCNITVTEKEALVEYGGNFIDYENWCFQYDQAKFYDYELTEVRND